MHNYLGTVIACILRCLVEIRKRIAMVKVADTEINTWMALLRGIVKTKHRSDWRLEVVSEGEQSPPHAFLQIM